MTVEEFYQWCKEQELTDYNMMSDEISVNGCFIGYTEVTPERTDIDHSERMVYV